jgi:serine/threonine protein kinase
MNSHALDQLDAFLVGKTLPGGWTIENPRVTQRDTPSLCRTYLARGAKGQVAFVKVLDPRGHSVLAEQQIALDEFAYEQQIVDKCRDRHMRRVIRGLDAGSIVAEGQLPVHVRYLVFEWAECDVRSRLDMEEREHFAVTLRWLHHSATALQELHYSKIVHQDLKPANVLVLSNQSAKLGDLGRAHDLERPRPHGDARRDPVWAPLEMLYGHPIRSFDDRCAADMYQLGSLAVFLFTSAGLTVQIERRAPSIHHWTEWAGVFADVLPYLRTYYDDSIDAFAAAIPERQRARLVPLVRYLTDPDPARRGHPRNQLGRGPRYGFERFVSAFDILAKEAEYAVREVS